MTKKSEAGQVAPPSHLSDRSKSLWASVVPTRARSLGRQVLVLTALEALDVSAEARRALQTEGLTKKTLSSGTVHVHPLVKVQADAEKRFTSVWMGLGFDRDPYNGPLERLTDELEES